MNIGLDITGVYIDTYKIMCGVHAMNVEKNVGISCIYETKKQATWRTNLLRS